MNVDILMVTFCRDLEFAEYSMRSVRKFTSGFRDNICVVPTQDGEMYREMAEPLGFTVKTFDEWPGKGFLHHEAIICEGDVWCPGADAILHIDGDCLFTGNVNAMDYFHNGRPILYRERFEDFKKHPNRYGWKACIKSATGIDAEWETMVRHPSVHIPKTYQATREMIAAHTGKDCKEFIRSCRNTYPQTFAEFPTLGAVAIEKCPDDYCFVDVGQGIPIPKWDKTNDKMKAFWSVGGIEMVNDRHPDETARQVMERILAD
jgi:hypothetical protein